MPQIAWDIFGGMESGGAKQSRLKGHQVAKYAKNARLWDGSFRAYREPLEVGACEGDKFVLDYDNSVKCVTGCAAFMREPCGSRSLYTLKDKKLHRDGKPVGKSRPTAKPTAKVLSGAEADPVDVRVLCLDEFGNASAPSATSNMIQPSYGSAVSVNWGGCTPYRLQVRLRQSMNAKKELGKDETQWVTVGDYSTSTANFLFRPETWELTDDGYDYAQYCDPPELCCFVVTDDGFFVGWNGDAIFISERHDPSKFIRSQIKTLHAEIYDIVTARRVLYISTSQGMFVARIEPSEQGPVVSLTNTQENQVGIPNTLGLFQSGAMYSTKFGVVGIDEAGRQPQNVSSSVLQEDIYERDWLPQSGIVQRGVYYATGAKESWHLDFPGGAGFNADNGRLVRLDKLGTYQVAGKDGHLYYLDGGKVYQFDRGAKYLRAEWESEELTAPAIVGFSRYRVEGKNLDGVSLQVFADGIKVYETTVTQGKICVLPRCVRGRKFYVKFVIPAKSTEAVVSRLEMATSMSEMARVA